MKRAQVRLGAQLGERRGLIVRDPLLNIPAELGDPLGVGVGSCQCQRPAPQARPQAVLFGQLWIAVETDVAPQRAASRAGRPAIYSGGQDTIEELAVEGTVVVENGLPIMLFHVLDLRGVKARRNSAACGRIGFRDSSQISSIARPSLESGFPELLEESGCRQDFNAVVSPPGLLLERDHDSAF